VAQRLNGLESDFLFLVDRDENHIKTLIGEHLGISDIGERGDPGRRAIVLQCAHNAGHDTAAGEIRIDNCDRHSAPAIAKRTASAVIA
jgi:hypothetical protein